MTSRWLLLVALLALPALAQADLPDAGLPDASVRPVPGAGHFLLLTHGEEILQSLVGA